MIETEQEVRGYDFSRTWQAKTWSRSTFSTVQYNSGNCQVSCRHHVWFGISAATLIGLNFLVSLLTYRNKTLEAVIEGRPQLLIHNGRLFDDELQKAKLTHHELNAE